jgi:hypothetical protein
MQIPSLTFSLRCTLPTSLTEPLHAHPSLTQSIRNWLEQIPGVAPRPSAASVRVAARQVIQHCRSDLVERIQQIGLEALRHGLEIGAVWSEVSALPPELHSDSPLEPLPLEIEDSVLVAAERSKSVAIDVIMALGRLRDDPDVADRLQISQGRLHPDLDALWSNLFLALMQEGVTSSLGRQIQDFLSQVKMPLAAGQDGVHPLNRLSQLGVQPSVLSGLLERHDGLIPTMGPRSLGHLLATLVHKQMWDVLRCLRQKGWDGIWSSLAQDLPVATLRSPNMARILERLIDLGLDIESLIHPACDKEEGSEGYSAILHLLLEGDSSLWKPGRRDTEEALEQPDHAVWHQIWTRLPRQTQMETLSNWLDRSSRVTSFLSYHNRVETLSWLLQEATEQQISLEHVRWPNRPSILTSAAAKLLLEHGGLREDPEALELGLQVRAFTGEPVREAMAFLALCRRQQFCLDRLEEWEQMVKQASSEPLEVESALEKRWRNGHQVLAEAWAIRPNQVQGLLVFAVALSHVLCRKQVGTRLPGHLRDLVLQPARALDQEGADLFETAWRASVDSEDPRGAQWAQAQRRALLHWLLHSPLPPSLTSALIQTWLDVNCIREGRAPALTVFPGKVWEEDDVDMAVEQARRALLLNR